MAIPEYMCYYRDGGGRGMKWISHEIVSSVIVYAATDNLLYTAYSMIGTMLPDKLEGDPRKAADYWSWRSRHRGWSHWPVPYLFLIAVFLMTEKHKLAGNDFTAMTMIGVFVMVGSLLHIAEDAVCGKVPLIYLTKKIGIKLFETGSFKEYFFAIFAVCAVWVIKIFLILGSASP